MKKIIHTIDDEGTTTVTAEGYTGPSCVQEIQKVLDLIGAKVTDARPTPEFFQQETQQQWLKNKA